VGQNQCGVNPGAAEEDKAVVNGATNGAQNLLFSPSYRETAVRHKMTEEEEEP